MKPNRIHVLFADPPPALSRRKARAVPSNRDGVPLPVGWLDCAYLLHVARTAATLSTLPPALRRESRL